MSDAAAAFRMDLAALSTDEQVEDVARFFYSEDNPWGADNQILGVSIGTIFPLAKRHSSAMSVGDLETLLEDPHYEVRMGAVAIMDFQARHKRTPSSVHGELYELYLRRHDRINNWDLVDRAARRVIGEHLLEGRREVLDALATSDNPWERRTSIVATFAFLRLGQAEDTFRICAALLADSHPMVQKAIASWLREAGKVSPEEFRSFLDDHHASMNRGTLRHAVSKLTPQQRRRYLG
ncbi:DNA alkylation repair protein [Natronoglycomyces albus]|uniref:DNA alkylation repair protein n=1 Tax=Natronoglycomyces albus TaxID=2811108 RepID=A0A895XI74_9ACTN|nr:DNA alkylation repair protein [Natronoglycomyces albus]QSB04657.1 DNA alkylation repair protein [Natronoglycomyces albus]